MFEERWKKSKDQRFSTRRRLITRHRSISHSKIASIPGWMDTSYLLLHTIDSNSLIHRIPFVVNLDIRRECGTEMCHSSFNFRFIFYKIDFGRKNRNIGYIERHETNRQYFVPAFLKERKLMVTSNRKTWDKFAYRKRIIRYIIRSTVFWKEN